MAASGALPVVDMAPFFAGVECGIPRATKAVREACRTHGFFRAINHSVPTELMARALELSAAFFALPDEEKAKVRPAEVFNTPLPVGYGRQPAHSADKNEYVLVFNPKLGFNVYPTEPAGFSRGVLRQAHGARSAGPEDPQRMHGPPAGLPQELQQRSQLRLHVDETLPPGDGGGEQRPQRARGRRLHHLHLPGRRREPRGAQGRKLGPSTAASSSTSATSYRLKSATHPVVRKPAVHRHSFAFFFIIHGDKWVEPLPEFTNKIGEAPRYRGFLHKEYQQLWIRNKTHKLSRHEDVINITHYAT